MEEVEKLCDRLELTRYSQQDLHVDTFEFCNNDVEQYFTVRVCFQSAVTE